IINGSVYDDRGLVTANFQYKYGTSGNVTNMTTTGVGGTFYTDRNPSSGTTSYTLSKYYYMTQELGYVNLYIHSSDNDTIYIYFRAYSPSTGWVYLYQNNNDNSGTKIDKDFFGMGYTQFNVYMYDQEGNDDIYYKVSYTDGEPVVNATIPGPGYSTWVYYRLSATDQAGNTNSTTWSRYWADGTSPTITEHTGPSSQPAKSPVTLTAKFKDDHAIDKAVIYYSFGGSYRTAAMTATSKNTTHLEARGQVEASLLPLNVTYYFRVYDKAGNYNDTTILKYSTYLASVAEGVVKTYDGSNLYTSVGYSLYEWDFDYSGTFNADATGVSRTHAFMDDGNYTIALRLTDNNFVVTTMMLDQKVTDQSPLSKITSNIYPYEGEDLLMNGSTSSS
ncbi:MAG: hypothetical protein KAS77_02065, partial [Thermoplasmata archaeon]|nr:hypothetical protein [Thermoplasmata archaeon]